MVVEEQAEKRSLAERRYDVVAVQVPIVFNRYGDHDHDGMIFTLAADRPALTEIKANFPAHAKTPHPLVRPLVLRACAGERLEIYLTNELPQPVGMHLVGDGYSVVESDGAAVGRNPSSLVDPGQSRTYVWECRHEGVFAFHDMGDLSGGEDGTNVHGLFGALVVEPEGSTWTDPETSGDLTSGLYADVHPPTPGDTKPIPYDAEPVKYPEDHESFREFVVFFHDEPHFALHHAPLEPDPCVASAPHGDHAADVHAPPLMPISYRAEPLFHREREIWRRKREGTLTKQVVGEEQHHSSWLFGDPATPILRAYLGDPIRIRLVHAGVKETHVFHLHVYEWHAVPENRDSPLIDAISIGPQSAHTIEPLWGAGNRQRVMGDVIWHCHLYPHFHEGMWGIFRTFDRRHDGTRTYPDGTPIARLVALSDREAPPPSTDEMPGFPGFIPGDVGQKSPVPPWPYPDRPMPVDLDYRPQPTDLERRHFNSNPRPGELFTRNPHPDRVGFFEPDEAQPDELPEGTARRVRHDLAVVTDEFVYNDDGWHDPKGHAFVLGDHATPGETRRRWEPLYLRAREGEVVENTLDNRLPRRIPGDAFDLPQPRCEALGEPLAECGLHVHFVKFDPVVADGASTGWNYLSGPVAGKKMIYRWWADEELGTIFFHDHLFANYRQKHGLFGALIVEPRGAQFLDPFDHDEEAIAGTAAVIRLPDGTAFREFCLGLADFVPLFDRHREPLNPPPEPGGHGDAGAMGVNYRSEPIRERKGDPAYWFSSRRHRYEEGGRQVLIHHGDPSTDVFETYPGEPIRLRIVQGSHEESHSLAVHGMRWRRFWGDPRSPLRNQQTTGISEAFTFVVDAAYSAGDHLWKLAAADDLWLGCWGLIRSHPGEVSHLPPLPGGHYTEVAPTERDAVRRFRIVAEARPLTYRADLVDPFALIYRVEAIAAPGGAWREVPASPGDPEPLVLRCRTGEWVEVELHNRLPEELAPEPFAPTVPVEDHERPVSSQVSLHADLLRYDVRANDGANVGRNPRQTARPGESVTYRWHADAEVGPILLQDVADFRNHRHHGLVGALVVEPADATPYRPDPELDPEGAAAAREEAWHRPRATIHHSGSEAREEEIVVILQDGLRLFLNGNLGFPAPDIPADPGEGRADHEDQGQKGFNYRTEPTGPPRWLDLDDPATPTWTVPAGANVRLHLVTAADKPRGHTFTVHAHTWPGWPHMGSASPRFSSVTALTPGSVRTLELAAASEPGDYAYRSGAFSWAVSQGLWGILRVV
ncbi:MAG: multicopper oxidase domain-containing protein [Actinomycetota bacterium]|nr:multicopper oxidase domain-containing protein [Actinomycetota bacterium]